MTRNIINQGSKSSHIHPTSGLWWWCCGGVVAVVAVAECIRCGGSSCGWLVVGRGWEWLEMWCGGCWVYEVWQKL